MPAWAVPCMWIFDASGASRDLTNSTSASRLKHGPATTSAYTRSVTRSFPRISSKKTDEASPDGNIFPWAGARIVASSRTPYWRRCASRASSSSSDRNETRGFCAAATASSIRCNSCGFHVLMTERTSSAATFSVWCRPRSCGPSTMTPVIRSRSENAWNSTPSTRIVSVTRTFSPRSGRTLYVLTSSRRYVDARTVSPSRTKLCRCHRSSAFSTRILISPVFGSRWRTRIASRPWRRSFLAISSDGRRRSDSPISSSGVTLSLASASCVHEPLCVSCIYTKRDAMVRKTTMARVRRAKRRSRESGFVVSWDVDSKDRVTTARVYRFVYGDVTTPNGKAYRYPGFVEKKGVRYLGQSVLFVGPSLLAEIDGFLSSNGIDHEIIPATVG